MASEKRKDAHLDQWVFAEGSALKELVTKTTVAIQQYERTSATRKRGRRPADRRIFERIVDLIVCNLALVADTEDTTTGMVAYPRDKSRKPSRYDNPLIASKAFTKVIDTMAAAGILAETRGTQQTGRSTFRPTDAFRSEFEGYGIVKADIGRDEGDELIVLRGRKYGGHHNGEWFGPRVAGRLEYTDNDTTRRYHSQIASINEHLEKANLAFLDDDLGHVDIHDRTLRRYFAAMNDRTARFDKGGRLFGGWWMNLPKHRRGNIRIDGERCYLLDYASMFARLAYARQGQPAPEGDLYDLSGLLSSFDATVGEHRQGVKKVFNALLFGGAMADRFPKDTRSLMPKGCRVGDVRDAIARKHECLAPMFGTLVGYDLMMDESRILISTLQALNQSGVTALPLHDGLLTKGAHAMRAVSAMMSKAKEECGYLIPVSTKTATGEETEDLAPRRLGVEYRRA